ncbi:FecR domain-containing protein [Stenotrophomonas sp. Iso1]|uniref:FecR family protein n=1 Tax=Stenotrophomonas sp. Iso1 TaxID=2977283 RepID=UPI0022B79C3C|nr:FecR domain-containing protein [Stenotrophomonas sp. Iso1]
MPSTSATADHAALAQAAWWYATLLDAGDDADQHTRWRQWLQDPSHARAWAQVEAISRQFEPLRGEHQRTAADAGLKAARWVSGSRRRVLSGLASLATLGVVGWQYPRVRHEWLARTAEYRTATGEIRATGLADGSRIWLAPGSALDVDYSAALRCLRLHEGEIHVQTAADTRRDFVIDTTIARLRALGTRFNVRLQAQALQLAVLEGAVEVRAGGSVSVLEAGQRLRVDAAGISTPELADPGTDAWIRGILMADQMPLGELIAELSRYRPGHLGVAPEIAGLPVAGVFPLRDPDAALAMLERSLPVRVRRTLPWWTTLEPLH